MLQLHVPISIYPNLIRATHKMNLKISAVGSCIIVQTLNFMDVGLIYRLQLVKCNTNMHFVSKLKLAKKFKVLSGKMPGFSIFPLGGCFDGCRDHTQASGFGTRIWNLSDKPVELQIRVGSILKKVHTLKPGSSKRLKCKSIYKAYMPGKSGSGGGGMKSLLYYYDETCHPYVWINETGGDSLRMVKQQYISLEELRDCSEIRIFRDHQRGCISVRKKPRPDFC